MGGCGLVIRPGRACRVVSGHIEVVGGIGAQAGDHAAGAAAAQAADLLPGAVDPFIDQVAGRAGHTVPRQVDLRC